MGGRCREVEGGGRSRREVGKRVREVEGGGRSRREVGKGLGR